MGKFLRFVIFSVLTLGLIACSNSDGGGKRKKPNGDGAAVEVPDADEKYEALERFRVRNARLQIVEKNDDVLTLSFDKLDNGSVEYTLNGDIREQESKLEGLKNSRINNVADVRNINFPSNTLTPSVFYVVTKEDTDSVRGDIYVFIYTDNQEPLNVAGPIGVRTNRGLDIFNDIVRAYEDAGKNYFEFLGDLLVYYNENPGANYRSLRNDLLERIEEAGIPTPPPVRNGTAGELDCTKGCDDDLVPGNDGRIVRGADIGVPEYRVRDLPRHEVSIIEERGAPVVDHDVDQGDHWDGVPPYSRQGRRHATEQCLDPRVKAYVAWGGEEVDLYPHRDDNGNQGTGNGHCTAESRERILERAREGTLNRSRQPTRPCASKEQLDALGFKGGFTSCRIKSVHESRSAAPAPVAHEPAPRNSGILSVVLRCGKSYGASMSVNGQPVNIQNTSACFNRPAHSIAAMPLVRLPGQNIPGVDLIAVGYNFDFTKSHDASQFISVGRVQESTRNGKDELFNYPTVYDQNWHRAQLNQVIKVVDRNGSEISTINMGCTVERHTHYCGH